MTTSYDTQAMEEGPSQSTITVAAPSPTNSGHIEFHVLPVNFSAAAEHIIIIPSNTNAELDDPEGDDEDVPLRVRLTGYRLLNIVVIFTIGVAKLILSLNGQSIAPTGLEYAGGSVLAIL